jgi:hypothetical protein
LSFTGSLDDAARISKVSRAIPADQPAAGQTERPGLPGVGSDLAHVRLEMERALADLQEMILTDEAELAADDRSE